MKRLGILVAICCCAVITTQAKIKNSLLVEAVKKQEAKAEEQNYGAQAMIKDGLFSRFPCPDYILAYHVSPEYPAGSVGYSLRETFAGLLNYDITFRGVGAHGAKPNTGIDPIVMASEAVMQFQTIPSRSVSPLAPSVVTVGSFHAGKVWNIIPDEATLQLTTRFYDMEVQKLIDKRIREICQGIAVSNGVPEERMPEIKPLQIASPVINDTPLAEAVCQSMRDILGDAHLIEAAPSPVSEDFAYYSQTPEQVRTMIFWLGVANPEKLQEATKAGQLLPQLHNECFAPQFVDSWATGVQAMSKALIDLLQ